MPASRFFPLGLLLMIGMILFSACGSPKLDIPAPIAKMAMSEMPDFVQNAPTAAQEAYQFAVSNPHALETVPCYCGCSGLGHKNNLDCYIKATSPDGTPIFDNHAAFCGICVDITQDVMRLQKEGKSAGEIRTYIDTQYGSAGPSTDTRMP